MIVNDGGELISGEPEGAGLVCGWETPVPRSHVR